MFIAFGTTGWAENKNHVFLSTLLKGDISTLQKRGLYYFALTLEMRPLTIKKCYDTMFRL